MKNERRMISKDGIIFEFPRYTSSKEEEEEEDEEEEEKEEEEEEKEDIAYAKHHPTDCHATNNMNNNNSNNNNNNNNNNENNRYGGNNRCSYKTFLACNPRDHDGKGGAIALTRWIEKMEYVIDNSGCAENKKLLMEEFCPSNKMEKLESEFWNHTMVGANHVGYTDRFHELAKLVLHLVTPESKRIERYINGLAPQIRKMLRTTQPTSIQSAILKAGILTDEAVRCGTLTRSSEKRKEVEETSKQGDCRAPVKQVVPVSAVRMGNNQRVCYESLEGKQNALNNGNQARGRAFCMNAVDALQDPNIVTGTFSLNDHFATILFDSGADFSFISTEFAPLLNVKPIIVRPGYVIEVANGKKKEVDKIIRDCKLELGNSLFTIDLIPLGHESFDVIVGMDWLSKNKAEIVCHEKVVRIPLEGGEILRVQGERTLGGTKTLMSTKADETKLSDIPIMKTNSRLQAEERDKYSEVDQVKMLVDLINQRKRYFAEQKAEAKRKKPMTQAQQRTYMSNYIKHMGSYTLKQLKKLSFNEIMELFEATMRSINDFVLLKSEDDKAVPKLAESRSSKRHAEEELDQRRSKKQKIDESSEPRNKDVDELSQEELQQLMIIVTEQGLNVEALQTKYPIID
nr:reverse transcriptase domain-containing protein [Tanacetum cinerariifolium]